MRREAFEEEARDTGELGHVHDAWHVNRIDVRSPLSQLRRHVVRVELQHPTRGRVTDIGSGKDILNAAFAAVSHIFDRKPSVVSIHACHREYGEVEDNGSALAAVVVDIDGVKLRGTATGDDLVYACLTAFLNALTSEDQRVGALLLAGLTDGDNAALLAARPCQASGVDENGDWWLFASDDAGAAEAIADEFRQEGYEQIRISLPGDSSRRS